MITVMFWTVAGLYVAGVAALMVIGARVHRGPAGPGGQLSEQCETGRHGYCAICGCGCHWDGRRQK